MPIRFFSEQTPFSLKSPRSIGYWIRKVSSFEKVHIKELDYIFCSDEYLVLLNQQYLNHNTFTDIITFDYSLSKSSIEGEIYISIDRIKENSEQLKVSFEDELYRVIIHGVLHLVGYKDKSAKEKALMRKKEDTYLSLYKLVPRGTKKTKKV